MLQKVLERISGYRLDTYLDKNFYTPMGLKRTGYLPAQRKDAQLCAPTNIENSFRGGLVQGYVHDPAAAMLGGVCGHAGLFSNSEELGVIMQMLLNKGIWDGKQYLQGQTIEYFTKTQNQHSHRGLGFDKPNGYEAGKVPNVSKLVPKEMFGHSGFTGTWAWADPVNNLVLVVLTNRVYPSDDNRLLIQLGIRGQIMDAVYKSMK